MYKNSIKGNRFRGIGLIASFVTILFGCTLASVVTKDRAFSPNENRVLQQKPVFSAERLFDGTFASEYESYVTDQFVGRDEWIGVKVYAERLLQKKDINGVYFGKDDYLIAQHQESEVDALQVKKNIDRLQQFVKKYESKIRLNVMIVPTASYVLKDKLPAYASEYDQKKLMAEIEAAVCSSHYIDVADTLLAHKTEPIYYRTDHHWTSLGAFYAYEAAGEGLGITPHKKEDFVVKQVTKDFLGTTYSKVNCKITPDTIEVYQLADGPAFTVAINQGMRSLDGLFDLEKLKEKDKYPVFLGGNNAYVEITGGKKNGRTLLVIKDSFAHTFVPFLADSYEKIIMIDYRYYNQSTEQLIEKEGVTDALVLYNTINFAEDKNLLKLLK